MILCIDVGNTAVKCAVLDGQRVLGREAVATPRRGDDVDLALAVRRATSTVLEVRAAILSSVVPELTGIVAGHVHSALGVRPLEVTPRLELPMELAVPLPATVGADRIAAAAGALDTRRRNAVVVDIGSAITVDVVRDGRFLGGVIMSGPATALSCLGERARRLPRIDYAEVDDIFPDSFDATEPSMVLGATLATVGGVREACRMFESRLGSIGHHVLTGGLAAVLAPHFPSGWTHDEDLVLRGLHRIAELNLPG